MEKQDSFWSWRELMYSFLEHLNPEQIEAIAALVFMEMLECGYASVGEFHYVHHQYGGKKYENIAETSCHVINAAQKAGIGLTHLPVFYMQSGLNGNSLAEGQLRFGNERSGFLQLLENSQTALKNAPEDYLLGIAPHSLRAVSPESLKEIVETRTSGPVHIHIAEQLKEVEEVLENYGARPVEWLLQNESVDSRWCLIHATHMIPEETQNVAKSGAVVGLCPITEANLGDGIFDGRGLLSSGGKYGIGSDSNVFIALKAPPICTFDNSFASNVFSNTFCIFSISSSGILILSILKLTISKPNLSNSFVISSVANFDNSVNEEVICNIKSTSSKINRF